MIAQYFLPELASFKAHSICPEMASLAGHLLNKLQVVVQKLPSTPVIWTASSSSAQGGFS